MLTLCMFHMKDSVWSALPPINNSSSKPSKPIILTVASMDSASFFRDRSLGADSPISVSAIAFATAYCFFFLPDEISAYVPKSKYSLTRQLLYRV